MWFAALLSKVSEVWQRRCPRFCVILTNHTRPEITVEWCVHLGSGTTTTTISIRLRVVMFLRAKVKDPGRSYALHKDAGW